MEESINSPLTSSFHGEYMDANDDAPGTQGVQSDNAVQGGLPFITTSSLLNQSDFKQFSA